MDDSVFIPPTPVATASYTAQRVVLARQYGHFAAYMSRDAFDRLIDELTSSRMRIGLGLGLGLPGEAFT